METDTTPHPHPWLPWVLALGLWLALAGAASVGLWQLRRDTVAHQSRELELLALALTDEIDRGLRGTETGLHALRTELQDGRLRVADPDIAPALRTRTDFMPLVRSLWLLDRRGSVLAASTPEPAPDLATFSPATAPLANDGVTLSRPFDGGGAQGMQVAMGIRFQGAHGPPGGWIVAALPTSTLLGAFSAAQPAAEARMAVFRSDGVRLAGANAPAPNVDAP